jgi:hypothetical protein
MASPNYQSGTFNASAGLQGFWTAVTTAMTTAGWTAYYTYAANDVVYQSPAYSSAVPGYSTFVRVSLNAGGFEFQFVQMMDCDTSGNMMNISTAAGGGSGGGGAAACPYRVRANQWAVACILGNSASVFATSVCTIGYAGWAKAQLAPTQQGFATLTAAVTAGSTVLTTNRSLVGLVQVGQTMILHNFAHNNSSANRYNLERVKISAVSATSVTLTAGTTNAYDTGAALINIGMIPGGNNAASWGSGFLLNGGWSWMCDVQGGRTAYNATTGSGVNGNIFGPSDYAIANTTMGASTVGNGFWDVFSAGVDSAAGVAFGSGIAHHVYVVCTETSPPVGTNYTDGTSVFEILVSEANNNQILWGPTNIALSPSTQRPINGPGRGYGDNPTTTQVTATPTLANWVPAVGTTLANAQSTIAFQILGTITDIIIVATYSGSSPEVIYQGIPGSGGAFTGPFQQFSTLVAISGGYQVTLQRTPGWPGNPSITTHGINGVENSP